MTKFSMSGVRALARFVKGMIANCNELSLPTMWHPSRLWKMN